ncbi:MAG: 16S rRNA (guanine(527)-N(7))-methyltransferase RsmG [Candidatus Nanopelagicales bacterium]
MSDLPGGTSVSRETAALIEHYSAYPDLLGYVDILVGVGVERGVVGPREVPRIWPRHIANCAVVAQEARTEIPDGSSVADVGSGAGLPGLVWAIVRPGLTVTLIEPLLRRATFLNEVVDELGLAGRVHVLRVRAEDVRAVEFDVVTARAVARLDRLAAWTLPLVRIGGLVVALKGTAAQAEASEARVVIRRHGGQDPVIRHFGTGVVDPPTTAVLIRRTGSGTARTGPGRRRDQRV